MSGQHSTQPSLSISHTSELHVFSSHIDSPRILKVRAEQKSPDSPESPVEPDYPSTMRPSSTAFQALLLANERLSEQMEILGFSPRCTIKTFAKQADLDSPIHDMCRKYGYNNPRRTRQTIQGVLYKAHRTTGKQQVVAIKQTSKALHDDNIAIQDDVSFCVSENIIKEATILKTLSVDNTCIGGHIVNFIDFVEDTNYYYLVMEYVESGTTLKEFVQRAHGYIADGTLTLKAYKRTIKYVYWQLLVTVRWLHCDMRCCHLELFMENVMLTDCTFIPQADGSVGINPSISIRIVDFGVAELFPIQPDDPFRCNKTGLSLENGSYLAPKTFSEDTYDARAADMWSLGMILFECLTGEVLYEPMDQWMNSQDNGFYALHHGCLRNYLTSSDLGKFFCVNSFELLMNLLRTTESKRLTAHESLKQTWFKMYYRRYGQRIESRSVAQQKKYQRNAHALAHLPLYTLDFC